MTVQGSSTEYPVPTAGSYPDEITLGPDSNIWFTEVLGDNVAKLVP